jgi:YD repeat-containing protein
MLYIICSLSTAQLGLNLGSSSGNFATFNPPVIGGSAAFVSNATPTSLDLVGATTAPDLAVSNISFTPANALLNQNVTVTFTVTNLGTVATTTGSWTDSVYLSPEAVVDSNAVLLGRVTHTGDLAPLAQYTATLTAAVPGLIVGSYHVIVVADSGMQVPDINRANSTGVATTELSTQPPTLTIGTPLSGTIADGQDLYYRLNVTPGTNVQLDATFAATVESELYLSFGALPTANSFDQSSTNLSDLTPELVLPTGQGGAYYIWLHGREGAGAGQPFTLLASLMSFGATAFTPSSAGQGPVTMDVTGSGFTPQTTVTLQSGGSPAITAQTVTYISANELNATFDLTSAPIGNYSVEVADSGNSSTAPGSFQVTAQDIPALRWTIGNVTESFLTDPPPPIPGGYSSPPPAPLLTGSSSGSGGGGGVSEGPVGPFSVGLSVENLGTNDVPMPAYELLVTNVFGGTYVLAAKTLAPGETEGLFEVPTPIADTPGSSFNVSVQEMPAQSTLDWASFGAGQEPINVSPDAWNAIIDNLMTSVGQTEGSLNAALQADAIYLAQVGDSVTQQSDLFSFEVLKAEDVEPVPTLGSAVDSSFTEPGLSLTFERSFVQSIVGRNQLGPLGYGWASNWDITAMTDSSGNVFIQQGGQTTEFSPQSNGSYQSTNAANQEVLTLANGSYTLRGADGLVTAFLPDRQLNYVQDASGNRITASYNAFDQMTSLTQSNGDSMAISYNTQGLISQITDPAGEVTTYGYDDYEQLTSVSNAQGTYQYTYVNGQAITQEHALASITNPDGTHTYFSYDSQGRLIQQSQDNGAGAITYAYLAPGGYTQTDSNGAVTTVLYDLNGQPAVITDPLGNVYRVTYNANGQPVLIAYPGGTASSNQYDAEGNLVSATDPLGNTSQFTTNPQTDETETFQNANGATTSFAYTAQEELQSITQPDGSGSQYFYNAQGEVTQSIDALGSSTYYTYDSHGWLILRLNPDGTSIAYGYDPSGNLTSVTDASGTITMTYDGANNLTRIVYSNGQFLAYTYNAGEQLTQMVDQSGFTENYTYNNLGQFFEVTDANGNLIVSYSYDLGGRLVGEVHGNGTYTTYTYDADGNVLSLVNFAPSGSINSSFAYTYNALNLVTSMTTAGGTTTYGYDADGRLTSVALPTGETITYQYDAMGNRTVVSDNGATTAHTSNSLNEYTSVGSATYSYDANGNLTVTTGGPGGNTTYTYEGLVGSAS